MERIHEKKRATNYEDNKASEHTRASGSEDFKDCGHHQETSPPRNQQPNFPLPDDRAREALQRPKSFKISDAEAAPKERRAAEKQRRTNEDEKKRRAEGEEAPETERIENFHFTEGKMQRNR